MHEFTHVCWVEMHGLKMNHSFGRKSSKGSRGLCVAFERELSVSGWEFWLLGPIDLSSNPGSQQRRDHWQAVYPN